MIGTMNAVEIIDEIKHLPPGEQEQVITFVRTLDPQRRRSGAELGDLAEQLAQTDDPAEAARLKEEIASGFYGAPRNA